MVGPHKASFEWSRWTYELCNTFSLSRVVVSFTSARSGHQCGLCHSNGWTFRGFLVRLRDKEQSLGGNWVKQIGNFGESKGDSRSHEGMMNDFVTHFCHIFVGREYDFVGLGGWFMSRGRIRWWVEQDWTMLQSLVRVVSSKRYIGTNITNIVADIPPIPFLGKFDHFPGSFFDDTVDGRNPAPPGMFKKPWK